MNGSHEIDWSAVSALWHGQALPASVHDRLAAGVRRHTRLMWIVTLSEIAILCGFGAFTVALAGGGLGAAEAVILVLVWVVGLGATGFSHWNRRGSWRAAAEDPPGWLRLTERRARGKVRVAWVAGTLALLQAGLVAALVVTRGAPTGDALVWAGAVAAGYVGWSAWYGRRAARELRELASVRALLREPPVV